MKKLFTRTLLFTLVCALAACANIDDLSDANTIKTFLITSYEPTEIVLDDAEITPENVILVPVRYGESRFPLKFHVSVSFDSEIDMVMGVDLSKELVLQSINDRIEFVVVAKSGMSRKYIIQADPLTYVIPFGFPVSLVSSSPADAMLCRRSQIVDVSQGEEEIREILTLYVAEPEFPLSMTVLFDTGDEVSFDGFENGVTALKFADAAATNSIRIIDNEHGSIRDAEIGLSVLETVKGGPDAYNFIDIHSDDLTIDQISANDKFRLCDYEVDNSADKITLWLLPTGPDGEEAYEPEFPVSFSVSVKTPGDDAQIFRMPEEFVFDDFGDGDGFWYVDGIGGYARRWTVEAKKYDDPDLNEKYALAEVESFTYRHTSYTITTSGGATKTAVTMDPSAVEIDRENGEIWLSLTEVYNAGDSNEWRLELADVSATVSEYAGVELPGFVWNGNDSWKTEKVSFDVTACDGTVKTWSVGVKDMRERYPGTACEITAVNSVSVSPEGAVLDPERPFVFDRTGRIITVRLKEDGDPEGSAYPISVSPDYTYTSGAQIMSQEGGTQALVFADVNSVNQIMVLAEDGETLGIYTVKLLYDPEPEPILSSDADVTSFQCRYTPLAITTSGGVQRTAVTLDESQMEIDYVNAKIWLALTSVYNAAQSSAWELLLESVDIAVSDLASFTAPAFRWQGNGSWQTDAVSFDVTAEDGTVKTWTVGIRDKRTRELSKACSITGVSMATPSPDYFKAVNFNSTAKTISVEFSQHDVTFPVSAKLNYTLSQGAEILTQDAGAAMLVFANADAVNTVRILAEDAETWQDYTVGLVIPAPPAPMEPNVARFTINSVSPVTFSVTDAAIDTDNGIIEFGISAAGRIPLTVNYTMTMERDVASQTMDLSGTLQFSNLAQTHTFTATATDGNTKQWTIIITPYLPQLQNANLDEWQDSNTPIPVGSSSSPYWTSANNAFVKGTSRSTGKTGYAALLKTGKALSKLTSGSLFLGWFDTTNIMAGLTDPVVLTFQGIEFVAGRKLVAIEVDAQYASAGTDGDDTGTIAVELVKQNTGSTKYEYHGKRPDGVTHPDNTAVLQARGRQLVGNISGTQNGESIKQMTAGQWETVRVPIDYSSMSDPFDYTHLVVICASSSQGDKFIGEVGSTLLLDNFRLIYEE